MWQTPTRVEAVRARRHRRSKSSATSDTLVAGPRRAPPQALTLQHGRTCSALKQVIRAMARVRLTAWARARARREQQWVAPSQDADIRVRHRRETCPFGEIPVTLRRRASMQYSRGGGTMSQMSVPAGAWEDLRREVRARTPASPRRPPDFLATRASSLVFPEFSSAARHGSRLARGAPPPPVPP